MRLKCKRVLVLLLTLMMFITALPLSAGAVVFSDVPSSAWYHRDVTELAGKGIINGTGGNKFSPSSYLSRADITAILARIAVSESDLNQYGGYTNFGDVGKNAWYTKYINWASSIGVVNGYGGNVFKPKQNVTRQELAHMITNFCNAMWFNMASNKSPENFKDKGGIGSWASASVASCQKAGIIEGDKGYFHPGKNAKRSEAAAMINRLLSGGYTKNDSYTLTRKKVWGYAADYVEFSVSDYTPGIAMANNALKGAETASSMIQRTGAKIAVNAAYFNMSTYVPYATIINNGQVLKTDDAYAPHRPAFTISDFGDCSIENFKVVRTPVLQKADGREIVLNTTTATNVSPSNANDCTRIIFTRAWGSSVGIYVRDAIAVDKDGYIVNKVQEANDISIPEGGYVLYQRARREYEGEFFNSCAVGDHIIADTIYEGAQTGTISASIAVGPRVVKDGQVYGDRNTYNKEGFFASDITSGTARRVGIGVKANGNVVILTAYCTVAQLGKIMQSTGCKDAINLDGGGSTTIYLDGKWLRKPDRSLSSMIYFK